MEGSRTVSGVVWPYQANNCDTAELLHILEQDIPNQTLSPAEILETLNQVKSRITSPEAAASFNQVNFKTLCFYAFERSNRTSELSLLALRCLANLLLLASKTRQYFADSNYAAATARRLRDSLQDELLCSRILFLLTYDTNFDFENLFQEELLAASIHENVASHATRYVKHKRARDGADTNSADDQLPTVDPGALTETLKLLFNLNQFYPSHVPEFSQTIGPILEILNNKQFQVQPLQQPVIALINSLLGLDLPGPVLSDPQGQSKGTALFPEFPPNNYSPLISILDSGVRSLSGEQELDGLVPLVTLLRRVYELAPADIKLDLQSKLLPSSDERAQPLGTTDSLPSRLLQLSTAPTVPRLKEGISSFLFELSDKDATTFVRNVGYGFAAGYLMTHNLPLPDSTTGDLGEKMTTVDGEEINPITGQRRSMEPEDPLPEMTDEEKEQEADRLFVLFDRLKATGVMNVVNPVEQAQNEGRFEELD